MTRFRKVPDIHPGEGVLRVAGLDTPVRFEVQGDPAALRPGVATMRATVFTTPEFAADAFKTGEGVLTTDAGAAYRARMLGYTAGSDVVFVELRI